ncbi:MAG: hypothetical protein LBI12_05400 [Treponema sp.]|jgi:hypothetical protein|nr:hypothetical protein [Treponema sp.]
MTLDEKSASLPGRNLRSAEVSGEYIFSDVLDEACEKLMDQQIKYSIRRIQEMENILECLEKELDDFLGKS